MFTTIRYRSIPSQFKKNEVDDFPVFPSVEEGKRIVDDSYYVPNHEANKILAKQQAMATLNTLTQFDSPKDIASGSVNVYARQKGRDLAELTQQARQLQAQAERDIASAVSDAQKAKVKAEKAKAQAQAQAQSAQPVSAESSQGSEK